MITPASSVLVALRGIMASKLCRRIRATCGAQYPLEFLRPFGRLLPIGTAASRSQSFVLPQPLDSRWSSKMLRGLLHMACATQRTGPVLRAAFELLIRARGHTHGIDICTSDNQHVPAHCGSDSHIAVDACKLLVEALHTNGDVFEEGNEHLRPERQW